MNSRWSYLRAKLTVVSGNRKLGSVPASISCSVTCPPGCAVAEDCYGKYHHLLFHWRRVDAAGDSWEKFCEQVAALPVGIPWRHNEVGDLPGLGGVIDSEAFELLVSANRGKRGFTYTHKPVLAGRATAANRKAIADANARGLTINLSADGVSDADAKAALGIGPVAVVLPHDVSETNLVTPSGRNVTVCPHHFDARIQCWFCGLCAANDRADIIGFPAHGAGKKRLSERLRVLS